MAAYAMTGWAGCGYPALPPLPDASEASGVPSCQRLDAVCGPDGAQDCCTSLAVSGGTYYRGYDFADDSRSGTSNAPAIISSFLLDKYEVTVGRFRAFVAASGGTQQNPPSPGAGAHTSLAGSGWNEIWNELLLSNNAQLSAAVKCSPPYQTWTETPGPNETRPMNCVNWYEAMAFCIWDGGFLPTEAEWNYASAGGAEQRAYPWSVPPTSVALDSAKASYRDGATCPGDGLPACELTDYLPVGSKPAGNGLWGHADLGGNVSEWTFDWFADYQTPCVDCAQLVDGGFRVFRGGNAVADASYMRAATRFYSTPDTRSRDVGFRCAQLAKQP